MTLTLKGIRLLNLKSQRQLADLLGVHVQTYRRLENNPEDLTISQAKKIAAFFGVSYNDIFFIK